MGQEPWNKGKTYELKHSGQFKKGIPSWNKGIHKRTSTKNGFKKGCIPWNKGKKTRPLSKEHIRKVLKRRPMSGLEIKFLHIVEKYKLPYKFVGNGKFFIERKNPDFININGEKKAIEVYWKRHKENIRGINIDEWKSERSKVFSKYGWNLIYIEGAEMTELKVLERLKGGK